MTRFRKVLVGVTAIIAALRLLFPVLYRQGERADLSSTFLQILALVVLAAAIFMLIEKPTRRGVVISGRVGAVGILLGAGYFGWQSYENAQIEASAHQIVEGQRIGFISLGLSLEQVRHRMGRPFLEASRSSKHLVEYLWDDPQGRWVIMSDAQTNRVMGVRYVLTSDDYDVPFETTKGVRYGQSVETVKAVYGDPAKTHVEQGPFWEYLGRPIEYYYPTLNTEFGFVCTDKTLKQGEVCRDYFYKLDNITIFSPGQSPAWSQPGQ